MTLTDKGFIQGITHTGCPHGNSVTDCHHCTKPEYPKTLLAVTNGTLFLNLRNEWDAANQACLNAAPLMAADRAKKFGGTVIEFQVIGRNEETGARIVKNPFTGEVSEA